MILILHVRGFEVVGWFVPELMVLLRLLACDTHYLFSLIQENQALLYSVKLTYYVLVIVIVFG